jgi:hypothetical protein
VKPLTYKDLLTGIVAVFLAGKRIGTMTQINLGWRYVALSAPERSVFSTSLEGCKKSLEAQ